MVKQHVADRGDPPVWPLGGQWCQAGGTAVHIAKGVAMMSQHIHYMRLMNPSV